ncbi:hypothetical protein FQN57_002768 [Myotisia sp. PD_48]|nr:hypothetical protein FQN57_002768 [Myotisia sp. PD_48]
MPYWFKRRPAAWPLQIPLLSIHPQRFNVVLNRFSTFSAQKYVYPQYKWIDGVENLERYELGGYHPVMIGDILQDRYRIVDKLGYGGYSTTWLARDSQTSRYVVVKIGTASSCPNETKILRELSALTQAPESKGHGLITTILDEFELKGSNGTHPCYTMVPAQGNLRAISFSALFTIEVARAISAELVLAIAFIHSHGYVHGVDIHLGNILAKLPSRFDGLSIEQFHEQYGKPEITPISRRDEKPLSSNIPTHAVSPLSLIKKRARKYTLADAQIILCDFGEAFAISNAPNGEKCHTPPAMRPPETRFEPHMPLSYAADIWSLGVAIWEIIGMQAIFSSEFGFGDGMISQLIDVLGSMPDDWFNKWEGKDEFYDSSQCPKEGSDNWPAMNEAFQETIQKFRYDEPHMGVFDEEETTAILDLIRRMLVFKPEQRLTIEEVLASEWMVKWALPALERARNLRVTAT